MKLPFMVDAKTVAQVLNVSESAVLQHTASGKLDIPRVNIGRTVRFRKVDVEAFIGAPLEEALGEEPPPYVTFPPHEAKIVDPGHDHPSTGPSLVK